MFTLGHPRCAIFWKNLVGTDRWLAPAFPDALGDHIFQYAVAGQDLIDGKNLLNGFCCLSWVGVHVISSKSHFLVFFTLQYKIMES